MVGDVLLAQGSTDLAELGNLEARYSETIIAVLPRASSVSSATVSRLASVGIANLLGLLRAAGARRWAGRFALAAPTKTPLRRLIATGALPPTRMEAWSLPRRARRRLGRRIESESRDLDRLLGRCHGAPTHAVCGGPSYSVRGGWRLRGASSPGGVHVAVASPHMGAARPSGRPVRGGLRRGGDREHGRNVHPDAGAHGRTMVSVRRYWPLAPLGRARLIASTRVARL